MTTLGRAAWATTFWRLILAGLLFFGAGLMTDRGTVIDVQSSILLIEPANVRIV
ncbi:hypothetical protein MTX20_19690 [Bradyrhizobium sp. ISRA435]|nr:hypothetical protein MTX20_19690 [Bradyrhizobium sp. ISRA435]